MLQVLHSIGCHYISLQQKHSLPVLPVLAGCLLCFCLAACFTVGEGSSADDPSDSMSDGDMAAQGDPSTEACMRPSEIQSSEADGEACCQEHEGATVDLADGCTRCRCDAKNQSFHWLCTTMECAESSNGEESGSEEDGSEDSSEEGNDEEEGGGDGS